MFNDNTYKLNYQKVNSTIKMIFSIDNERKKKKRVIILKNSSKKINKCYWVIASGIPSLLFYFSPYSTVQSEFEGRFYFAMVASNNVPESHEVTSRLVS